MGSLEEQNSGRYCVAGEFCAGDTKKGGDERIEVLGRGMDIAFSRAPQPLSGSFFHSRGVGFTYATDVRLNDRLTADFSDPVRVDPGVYTQRS